MTDTPPDPKSKPIQSAVAAPAVAAPAVAAPAVAAPAVAAPAVAAPAGENGNDNIVSEPLDADQPTGQEKAPPIPTRLPEPETRDIKRENVRGEIAKGLIVILWAVVVASFATLWMGCFGYKLAEKDALKDILTIIFAPIVALVGAATGYYFGGGGGTDTGPMKGSGKV